MANYPGLLYKQPSYLIFLFLRCILFRLNRIVVGMRTRLFYLVYFLVPADSLTSAYVPYPVSDIVPYDYRVPADSIVPYDYRVPADSPLLLYTHPLGCILHYTPSANSLVLVTSFAYLSSFQLVH